MEHKDELDLEQREKLDEPYRRKDSDLLIGIFIAGLYLIRLGIPMYLNTICTRDIGEGFKVAEVRKWRRIYDKKTNHVYCSHKGSGLEWVGKITPVPPSLGGPGWAVFPIESSLEDRVRFQRANYLIEKGGK